SKRLLLSVIVALIITNIATFLFWNKNESVLIEEDDEGTKVTKNEYVAQIGDEKITYKDWTRSLRETHGKNHLKHLIDRSIVKQMAKQEDIQISDKVIDREIALLTTINGMMTKEEAELEEKKWREDILHRYQLEALL